MTELRFVASRRSGIIINTPETSLADLLTIIAEKIKTYGDKPLKKTDLAARRINDNYYVVRHIDTNDVLVEIYIK